MRVRDVLMKCSSSELEAMRLEAQNVIEDKKREIWLLNDAIREKSREAEELTRKASQSTQVVSTQPADAPPPFQARPMHMPLNPIGHHQS